MSEDAGRVACQAVGRWLCWRLRYSGGSPKSFPPPPFFLPSSFLPPPSSVSLLSSFSSQVKEAVYRLRAAGRATSRRNAYTSTWNEVPDTYKGGWSGLKAPQVACFRSVRKRGKKAEGDAMPFCSYGDQAVVQNGGSQERTCSQAEWRPERRAMYGGTAHKGC